jgi:V/A-type H+-transporting ATPase subunit E
MSIENITEKIISEANNIAETSLKEAEELSLEKINEAKEKANLIINEASESAKVEASVLISRKVSSGELQERKMILGAKQEAVKKSFNIALEKLSTMPKDKYINFLVNEILNNTNCEGEIVLNEADKVNIGEELVNTVNDKLNDTKVVLSNNTVKTRGGFILKNGDIEVNSTFEALLSSIKEGLTFEVANALFK